jgi:hypothetical protein
LKEYTEPQRAIPVAHEVDVAVIGGGVAGIAAAIAAARNGAKTMIVERLGMLGGVTSATLMTSYSYGAVGGELAVGGIGHEMISRMEKAGYAFPTRWPPTREESHGYRINVEYLRYLADVMMKDAGVKELLHTWACSPIMEGNKVVGLTVENKSGRQAIFAKQVIDCSGDADLAARAGAPFAYGRERDGKVEPVSVMPRLTNYDREAVRAYQLNHTKENSPDALLAKARAAGEFNSPAAGIMPRPEDDAVNSVRVINVNPTDVESVTWAEIECRRQLFEEMLPFLRKYIPGCAGARWGSIGTQMAARESRRIIGDYTLTEQDVLLAKKKPDVVACYTCFIDRANPDGYATVGANDLEMKPEEFAQYAYVQRPGSSSLVICPKPGAFFDVPWRCLVPQKVDNLLVAGKNISATHMAVGSIRYLPVSMATGEAAGVAAAAAADKGIAVRDTDVPALQKKLEAQGAILHPGK